MFFKSFIIYVSRYGKEEKKWKKIWSSNSFSINSLLEKEQILCFMQLRERRTYVTHILSLYAQLYLKKKVFNLHEHRKIYIFHLSFHHNFFLANYIKCLISVNKKMSKQIYQKNT